LTSGLSLPCNSVGQHSKSALLPAFVRDPVPFPPLFRIELRGHPEEDSMIKTALVAMTVMGCDCDAKLCEFIGETPPQWATVGECEAAMKAQILRHKNFEYPLISGLCRTVPDQSSKLASAEAGAGKFSEAAVFDTTASVKAMPGLYSGIVAESQLVFRRTAGGYSLLKSGVSRAADRAIELARRSVALLPGF